jgi:hypothetical protein
MPGRGLWALLLVAISMVLISACNVADVQLTNTPVPDLKGTTGSFDVIQIDQTSHRLYVSVRIIQGIDVFDVSSARASFLKTVPLASSPNGLAIAPDLGRLYAGTSTGSIVTVDIDPKSSTIYAVLGNVPTGAKAADLLDYAPSKHLVFAASASEGTIASLDTTTGKVTGLFKVGHGLEQPRFNTADGMLYITSPDTAALFRINPDDGTIGSKIPLAQCRQPTGLAINPSSNQALIACKVSVVSWDFAAGTSQVFNQVGGGDVVTYDAKIDRFFVAAPGNKPASAVAMFGGNPVALVSSVVTEGGGHSAAYDETNDAVYTPDTRANLAGLTSFQLPATDQLSPSTVWSLGVMLLVMVAVGLIVVAFARWGDPIKRQQPAPAPVPSRRSSRAPN